MMRIDLTTSELETINIIAAANVIYNRTRGLSHKVNTDLLDPISEWIDDPDFMKRHKVMIDKDAPNWREYKRNERQWNSQQKQIAAERLRLYWKEIRRKKNFRKELSKILSISKVSTDNENTSEIRINSKAIAEIVAPFSPPETLKAEAAREFNKAKERSPSSILPWQTLLNEKIATFTIKGRSTTFNDLPQYLPKRKTDKVAKLQILLQMASDSTLYLVQREPYGEIEIVINQESDQSTKGSIINIKDQSGNTHEFSWQELNSCQQKKVIKDLINYKIIYLR